MVYGQMLPPGVENRKGKLWRVIKDEEGNIIREKLVSLDLNTARLRRMDFYHEEFGWLIDGFKRERNQTVEEVMADGSSGRPDPRIVNPESYYPDLAQ